MFSPDEIEHKEFVATLRGYDRDEVTEFLGGVAEDMRALQAMLDERDARAREAEARRAEERAVVPDDDENFGAHVANILRAARASAEEITERSQAAADELHAETTRTAAQLRSEATAERDAAMRQAEELLHDARTEAARILSSARSAADAIAQEALLRQEEVESANRSALDALVLLDDHVAGLRSALETSMRLANSEIGFGSDGELMAGPAAIAASSSAGGSRDNVLSLAPPVTA